MEDAPTPKRRRLPNFKTTAHYRETAGAIQFRLIAKKMRYGDTAAVGTYAHVVPHHTVTLKNLCDRMQTEGMKYRSMELVGILDHFFDVLTRAVKEGNGVNLQHLGYFAPSIPGAFNPEKPLGTGVHPVRLTFRPSAHMLEELNTGVRLARLDALPTIVHVERLLSSEVTADERKRFGGTGMVFGALRPHASKLTLEGGFRNLPVGFTVLLEPVDPDTGLPLDEGTELPCIIAAERTHPAEVLAHAAVDTSSVADRLLPGTHWRLTVESPTENPYRETFAVTP